MWSNDFEGEAFLEISKLPGVQPDSNPENRNFEELKLIDLALTHPKGKTEENVSTRRFLSFRFSSRLDQLFQVESWTFSSNDPTIKQRWSSFADDEKQKNNETSSLCHFIQSVVLFCINCKSSLLSSNKKKLGFGEKQKSHHRFRTPIDSLQIERETKLINCRQTFGSKF